MKFTPSLRSTALVIIIVPLVFEFIIANSLINLSKRADLLAKRLQDSEEMVDAADRALRHSVDLLLLCNISESDTRAFNIVKLKTIQADIEKIDRVLGSLSKLQELYGTEKLDRFLQQCRFVRKLAVQQVAPYRNPELMSSMPRDDSDIAKLMSELTFVKEEQKHIIKLARLSDKFISDENKTSARIAQREKKLRQVGQLLLLCGLIGNIVIAWYLNHSFNRSILRRLLILMENSQRLALKQTLNPAEPSSDEIGRLDESLHSLSYQLEEARAAEKAAIGNAVDLICSIDNNQRFVDLSPSIRTTLAYDEENLFEKDCFSLCADEKAKANLLEGFIKAKEQQTGSSCEIEMINGEGERRFFSWSIFWSETEAHYFCVVHDIHDRVLAQQRVRDGEMRVRSLIDKMPAGLAVFDEEGKIEEANEFLSLMLKSAKEELPGKNLSQILSPGSSLRAKDLLSIASKAEQLIPDLELIANDQSKFPAEALATSIISGGASKRIAVFEDLSESKELERIKRELLATLTHDIRTPLSSVKASLTLLSSGLLGNLSSFGASRAAAAENAAAELISLTNGVLELARLRAEPIVSDYEICDLRELCLELLENYSDFAAAKHLKLKPGLNPAICPADLEKLSKALGVLFQESLNRAEAETEVSISLGTDKDAVQLSISCQGTTFTEPEIFQITHGGASGSSQQ